ncbi:DUF6090 family protein [Neolewinella persica]|uniref:DUF6090 family protein n=1 Tax=Neolewinella persica TaxID=70998 RepID=UPI00036A4F5A|nr:DUF6090 family protein [Neolewinella persica]
MLAKRILNKRTEKQRSWFSTVLQEILIIIVGILLSFWISNGFESRKDAKLERTYLTQLKGDLKIDLEQLSQDYQLRSTQLESTNNLMRGLALPSGEEKAQLIIESFRNLLLAVRFSHTNATFRMLESTGHLKLITNNSIVSELIGVYGNGYDFIQDNNDDVSKFRDNFLLPFAIQHLNFREALQPSAPDRNLIISADEQQLMNQAIYLRASLTSTVSKYAEVMTQVEALVDMVERELE